MDVSVIGLGKLGLCTAGCFAAAGHTVIGYDLNGHSRDELKARRSPIDETGLEDLLEAAWDTFHVVDSCEEALRNSDATLIIVPTPSRADGRFSNEYVVKALESLAPTLAAKASFHLIAVVSTVMPGSSDRVFRPLLERLTGKRCGVDFGLAYNPEFIALGSVIRNFLNPDMVLIGASDERTGNMLTALYRRTCKTQPVMAVMSLINAEITKISLNCYVTMKISYANALAAICEQVPGADVDTITAAIGADSRVGGKYLKGGLGFGGPCFPRDNIAFQSFAEEYGAEAVLGKAVVAINNAVPERLHGLISAHAKPPAKVALLGMSYKADTQIIEESQSIMLATVLLASGYQVVLHDPKAHAAARQLFGDRVTVGIDLYEAVAGVQVVVLLTDWPEYRAIDWRMVASVTAPQTVVLDSWRIAKDGDMSAFTYIPVGIGISPEGM
ncbi:MAG: nucleotide sugar dehydrogenase [Geobacteraceae bacterium]|nr:nucleotide sugar dehydrogenase [Geobacteraceae bacterium]